MELSVERSLLLRLGCGGGAMAFRPASLRDAPRTLIALLCHLKDKVAALETWNTYFCVLLFSLYFTSDRISRLRECENLEEAARAVLKHLGEVKRSYLTVFESELLSFLEAKCSLQV
ncbi:hypothetical protein [Anabaena azotica]|uniref:Uncharacterized protein n=1 Tax=Anabaena azotica FACHB-119 TaxID=947527 RepID=A0ABR8DF74_9NOST|nr:hypothetical protein [Anabaena azotica]MBD2505294.1 hypothetical protein [Anabaena azotica FACHB-119]